MGCRLSTKLVPTFAVSHGQRNGSLQPYCQVSRLEPLLFLPSSSSIVLTRLSGPHSRPTTSQKICSAGNWARDLWICSQKIWPLDRTGSRFLCSCCDCVTSIIRQSSSVMTKITYRPIMVWFFLTGKVKDNLVGWVRERTIPLERPPLVGEVSANFFRIQGATWSAWWIPAAIFSAFWTGKWKIISPCLDS
jgi:hypothetical protein